VVVRSAWPNHAETSTSDPSLIAIDPNVCRRSWNLIGLSHAPGRPPVPPQPLSVTDGPFWLR